MLGARKSAIQVTNTAIKNRTDQIKKVDIDIFKSGEENLRVTTYSYEVSTQAAAPIKIVYMDEYKAYMRFRIDINIERYNIHSVILDSTSNLNYHFVITDKETGEGYYEISTKLEDNISGLHTISLKLGQFLRKNSEGVVAEDSDIGNEWLVQYDAREKPIVQKYKDYLFKFYVIEHKNDKGVLVDLPIDSYRDALLNVTKLWLLSSQYDRVRRPDWAGFFDTRLRSYQMSDAGAAEVEQDLKKAIQNKISGVYISEVKATPNLAERGWSVDVVSTDVNTQISTSTTTKENREVVVSIDNEHVGNVSTVS